MKNHSDECLYVFAHIPKTGGTSLRVHFQNFLIDQEEFIHCADKGDREARALSLQPFALRSLKDQQKAKVILGHNVNFKTGQELTTKNKCKIIVFRDPTTWLVSRYNQAMHERLNANRDFLSFAKWVQMYPNVHSQFNWFTYHYLNLGLKAYDLSIDERNALILDELKGFDYVFLLSDLNEKIKPIMQSLKIDNLTERKNVSAIRNKQFYRDNKENQQILASIVSKDESLLKKITFN